MLNKFEILIGIDINFIIFRKYEKYLLFLVSFQICSIHAMSNVSKVLSVRYKSRKKLKFKNLLLESLYSELVGLLARCEFERLVHACISKILNL